MKLLCFDTATDVLTCAVWNEGELAEHHEVAPRRHAERLLAAVDRVLAEAGVSRGALDAIAFGRGPGSFIGLRIAAGTAQGLAFALEVPAIPVSTLAVIAQGSLRENGSRRVLAVLDARLGEVYAGAMRSDGGIMRHVGEERLCRPEELATALDVDGDGWVGCGPGWDACADGLRVGPIRRLERLEPDRLPRARDLAVLAHRSWEEGLAVPAERAMPVYLRDRVAQRPDEFARR